MTPDPTPPGIHPTDAMLLLLGDVGSDADAAALVAELRLDEASGSLTVDDPFAPLVVAESWRHLGSCDHCSLRRRALLGELTPAIWSAGSDPTSVAAFTLDGRVRAAVAELVPTPAAVPESLARPQPPRRRWFAGRGVVGSGAASGHGGALARPWIVGIAAAALLLAVGTAFVLRPRTTERSAVGTVPPRIERAAPSDTSEPNTSPSPQPESAVVGTEASLAAGVMADEQATSVPATDGTASSAPDTVAKAAVDRVAPNPAAPEAAAQRATSRPVQPSPAGASSKATTESAGTARTEAANPVPPQPPKKKASAPAPVASAAAASPAGSEPPAAGADLGTFADAASALDRFAARAAASADAAAAQLGQQPGLGSANASNTASPAAAPLSAAASPAEPVLCSTVKGSPRLSARIGDRAVIVVRTADATADVVVDAVSCVELARRSIHPTASTVGG